MWCTRCNNDLQNCKCSDIDERLATLNKPGTHVYMPVCEKCRKVKVRCVCVPDNVKVQ